jgi:LysR family transcriptional regulator, flagellar master operon regulator
MDLDLAQTFIEVVNAGSFARAAERLHVTQAAVSARLQSLEAELGQRLFIRNKSGARMTPAGREFLPYATQLVHVWERARRQVAQRPGREALLSLGGEFSLWSALLLNWLVALRRDRPGVALRTQVDTADRLLDRVQTGTLDVAVMYTPHHRPGVEISALFEEELVAVSTQRDRRELGLDDYVYVDWGPDFAAHHDAAFPGFKDAANLAMQLGPLALRYILTVGGSGYFRRRAVKRHIESGQLHRVAKTPVFSYSAYAAHSAQADAELVAWARQILIRAARSARGPWA